MNELSKKVLPTSGTSNVTKINLYYVVPSDNFTDSKTDPPAPSYYPTKFDVFIVSIPNPNNATVAQLNSS